MILASVTWHVGISAHEPTRRPCGPKKNNRMTKTASYRVRGTSTGLGDRLLQALMAATFAKVHNVKVVLGWAIETHADTEYGARAHHKALRFNISASAYPWPITDLIDFPPELRVIPTTGAEWRRVEANLPTLELMPPRPTSPPNEFACQGYLNGSGWDEFRQYSLAERLYHMESKSLPSHRPTHDKQDSGAQSRDY